MIVFGGVMGLLAGYGALRMMGDNGIGMFATPSEAVNEPATPATAKESTTPDWAKPREPRTQPERQIRPEPRTRREPRIGLQEPVVPRDTPKALDPLPFGEPKPLQLVAPPPPPAIPTPSAVVTLSLDDALISVIATPDGIPVDELLCDVAFSNNLFDRYGDQTLRTLFVERQGDRAKKLHELPLTIDGAGAAIEIRVKHNSKTAVCEIRSQFSLPVNGIEPLTTDRGTTIHNKLTKMQVDIAAYKQQLPELKKAKQEIESALSSAQRIANGPASNAQQMAVKNAAIGEVRRLNALLGKNVAATNRAQALVDDEGAIAAELKCLDEISVYAKEIANHGFVYVRFYKGDVTVPAVVK